MRVYVKWDPVLEEVICVHSTEDGSCEKCIAVHAENIKHSYWVGGNWFDVIEDAPSPYLRAVKSLSDSQDEIVSNLVKKFLL